MCNLVVSDERLPLNCIPRRLLILLIVFSGQTALDISQNKEFALAFGMPSPGYLPSIIVACR